MNRRQRRAQESSTNNIKSVEDIPLSQPDRPSSSKKSKTLYEIAAEKQAELLPRAAAFDGKNLSASNVVNVKIGADGKVIRQADTPDGLLSSEDEALGAAASEPLPPVLDTLFLTTSLSTIHFTLETLTVHQYAQELLFKPIFKHTLFVAFPALFLLIHIFHGHLLGLTSRSRSYSQRTKYATYIAMQLVYVVIANISGCYLIRLTNYKGYYAVMKNAPSVGTIWVWAVIELGLAGALAGVVGPGVYAWYNGYGIF